MNQDPFADWAGKLPDSDTSARRISWIQLILVASATWDLLCLMVSIVVVIVAVFYFSEHRIRLGIAFALTAPILPSVAKRLFTSREQFLADYGFTSEEGLLTRFLDLRSFNNSYGRFVSGPTIDLTLLWFFVQWATFVAAAYHFLGFVSKWVN
jgi:hypothetical protein